VPYLTKYQETPAITRSPNKMRTCRRILRSSGSDHQADTTSMMRFMGPKALRAQAYSLDRTKSDKIIKSTPGPGTTSIASPASINNTPVAITNKCQTSQVTGVLDITRLAACRLLLPPDLIRFITV